MLTEGVSAEYGDFHSKFKYEIVKKKRRTSPIGWAFLEYGKQFCHSPTTRMFPVINFTYNMRSNDAWDFPPPFEILPDSKVHGANMGPIWGRQDPGGTHIGPMNLALGDVQH